MSDFTVIGGNVSGVSAALSLAARGHYVTLYEEKVWRKPCGGGISVAFRDYLRQQYQIKLDGHECGIWAHNCNDHVNKPLINIQDKIMVNIDRMQLQRELINVAAKEPNITIINKKYHYNQSTDPISTKQVIVSTGINKTGIDLLQSNITKSKFFAKGYTIMVPPGYIQDYNREQALICFDFNYLGGYYWLFPNKIEAEDYVDLGFGGTRQFYNKNALYNYLNHCNDTHCEAHYTISNLKGHGWGIPITTETPHHNFYNAIGRVEFFGTGDLAGSVTLLAAAGIETAWLSGDALGFSLVNGKLDKDKYAKLLRQNITYQKPKILSNDWRYQHLYLTNFGSKLSMKMFNLKKKNYIKTALEGTSRFLVQTI